MKRRRWRGLGVGLVVGITAIAAGHQPVAAAAQEPRVEWYVVSGAMNAKRQSLSLGDGHRLIRLANGWSCVVGAASKRLPAYEARTTICEKGEESFRFAVQCERAKENDHTQIGFLDRTRRERDFIEVGCRLE